MDEEKNAIAPKTVIRHIKQFEDEEILIRHGKENVFDIDEEVLGIRYPLSPVRFKLSEIINSRAISSKVSQISELTNEIMAEFRKRMKKGKYVPERYSIHIDIKPHAIRLDKAWTVSGGKSMYKWVKEDEEKRIQRMLKRLKRKRMLHARQRTQP